jgi:hypothetical protein
MKLRAQKKKNDAKGDVSLSQYRGGIYSPRGMAGSHGHFKRTDLNEFDMWRSILIYPMS